jgi:hypothetical protein
MGPATLLSAGSVTSRLRDGSIVAEVEGIAGFGVIFESHNELRAVYVGADFGGRGVGSALLCENLRDWRKREAAESSAWTLL